MNHFENNAYFWQKLDSLFFSSSITITQPAGSSHPKYANLVYPVNYGILKDTQATEQAGISIYRGSRSAHNVEALVLAADILNKDIDVKLLVGCTDEEIDSILRFVNSTEFQKSVILRRGTEVPAWAQQD